MPKINVADHLIRWGIDDLKTYASVRQLLEKIGLTVDKEGDVVTLNRYICVNCPERTTLYLAEDIKKPRCPHCGNDSTIVLRKQ